LRRARFNKLCRVLGSLMVGAKSEEKMRALTAGIAEEITKRLEV
jgi:hypothetical protein